MDVSWCVFYSDYSLISLAVRVIALTALESANPPGIYRRI
jgi:hypothetical protein